MAINLHEFTGEERVDTELAPLLNENFNALKDYADDASRWQILPVQFSGDNVKYLLQETSLSAANTTYVLPLIKIDDTNVASACDLRFIILKENGSINGISADIKLQKISSTNCAVNYSFTPSEDITLEPCTFTYESVKYAGLKITVGADLPECIWANGFITEVWQDAIAYKSGETVSNNEINNSIQVLGSDMVLVANMFKHLQTDKSPVSDYDVVNKKSLNDLTNVKTYSALSQIGLSGDVLDFHPYTIGNALPANSMLIIGIGGDTNDYNYPVTMGNLTVVRANTNHVLFQIDQNDSNGYNTRYVLEYNIDTASVSSPTNWKQILTDIDTGYWKPNETVTKGTVRKLLGAKYAGCFLVCKVAGTTGSTYPSPNPEDGAGLGGGGSSNLTTYTSLEQIGIVPGTETFESIHEALPDESEIVYWYWIGSDLNHDLYPGSYGLFRGTKIGSNTIFSFDYTFKIGSSNEYSVIRYESYYNTYEATNRSYVWNKLVSEKETSNQNLNSDLYIKSNKVATSADLAKYLPLIGGLMSNTIDTSKVTGSYRSGNLGESIINSTAAGGSYVVLATMNSTNGKFTLACYQGKMLLQYTSNTTIATEENKVDKSITLMDESGATSLSTWTISGGTNGWARESSTGLTLQWGTVTTNKSANTVKFPRVFTTVYNVNSTIKTNNTNGTSGSENAQYVSNITNTSFNAGSRDAGNGYAGFTWIAVGIS